MATIISPKRYIAQKIYDNGDSLAIDGANGTWFNISVDVDSLYSFSNIAVGVMYSIAIKNTHATNKIIITNPNTSSWKIASKLTSIVIPVGWTIVCKIIYDGTYYYMMIEDLTKEMS